MRTKPLFSSLLAALCVAPCLALASDPASTPEVVRVQADQWLAPTSNSKPWTFWWWPGLSLTKEDISAELTRFAKAGYGGVTIVPIYGVKGQEDKALPFLSPGHLAMLEHAGLEARRLGLQVDMSTTTGWPFGGPNLPEGDAELKIAPGADGKLEISPTKFKVKRAAPGAEGLVIDPYSTTAMKHYLERFDKALGAIEPGLIRSQYHDSFEYQANWSTALPARFEAMHGYDLRTKWTELSGSGDPDTVARVKYDYRQTLSALHLDYIRTWVSWSHTKGMLTRNQAHGSPGGLLDLYAAADIPETECFGASQFPIPGFRPDADQDPNDAPMRLLFRFASSGAHLGGRKLVASETFTWLRNHFGEAPSQMKPELDQLYLAGVNHIVYHGACYSPDSATWPGWLFYASTQFNSRNPLWEDFSGINGYITRVQSLLQAAEADNDLLVYWPEEDLKQNPAGLNINMSMHKNEWLRNAPYGKLLEQLAARGAAYDLVSAKQLSDLKASPDKGIQVSGTKRGSGYRAILVPACRHMEPAVLAELLRLASEGCAVLFQDKLPTEVPGLGRLEERRAQFKSLREKALQGASSEAGVSTTRFSTGRVVVADDIDKLLSHSPVQVERAVPSSDVSVARHELLGQPLYLVVNNGAKTVDSWLPFARLKGDTLLLDPVTGRRGKANTRVGSSGETEALVQIAPGETRMLLGCEPSVAAAAKAWPYSRPCGSPLQLSLHWKVSFLRGGPVLPDAFETDQLDTWTKRGGAYENFSGTAAYETSFELPADSLADDWQLDLGDLRETARITINGTAIPLVWSLPYVARIGEQLKPGKNTLRIEVTNLGTNRIRDLDRRKVAWKIFRDINIVSKTYKPFDASNYEIAPSGLLGPVTLTPLKSF